MSKLHGEFFPPETQHTSAGHRFGVFSLLGASGWAVRLPFVFLALAAVAFVRAAAAAAAPDDRSAAGLLAALLLVASPFFGRYAPHASPEVFLALSVALALLGLLRLPAPDGAWWR